MPPALLVTVDIPDETPFRCADGAGGCDLLCLRCLGNMDICCVEDRVCGALGGDGECTRDDELDASVTSSSRSSDDSECFRFLSPVKGGEGRDDWATALLAGSSAWVWNDLKPLSHCFLYNRKSAIVARASVTCSSDRRETYDTIMQEKRTAYTTVFTTLDGDAKFLLYEDAQRGATGFDDAVFICQRLGVADLRRRMGKQECLYTRKIVRQVSCMRGARTLRSLYTA